MDDTTTTVVTPLPLDEAPAVTTNAEYTQQTIDGERDRPAVNAAVARNTIRTMLDEIDVASSIAGSDVRIRLLTKKIRDIL